MFRLKTLYPALILFLFILFHLLFAFFKIPYAFVNLVLLAAVPAAYLYENRASSVLSILSITLVAPYMLIALKSPLINTALPLLIFNSIVACFVRFRENMDAEDSQRQSRIRREEEDKAILSKKRYLIEEEESRIKESELSTVGLYEVTRKMSEDLKFNDIFGVFSSFLKINFIFRKCDLLILNWDEESPRLETTYRVWQKDENAPEGPDMDIAALIRMCTEQPKKLYFSRNEDAELFGMLRIKEHSVESFVAIPLSSDGRAVAILIVENLSREELEKFIILSMQFSLEIKKVLLYEAVEKLATTDSLTGLYVRQYFLERLNEELQRSRRYKLKFTVLMIDIDDFKEANDTYGHLVGDVILKSIGLILKENTREIDLVSRYGGEEFAMALPETGSEGAKIVAERIRKRVAENVFKAYDEKLRITISAGISIYPRDSGRLKELIEKSDKAMYAAKKMGKNLVCEYKREYNNGKF